MFKGLSSLRSAEQKAAPVSEKSKALQAYLAAQYGEGAGGEEKKKKKKKKAEGAGGPALKILDQDVSGFAAAGGADKRRAPGLPPAGPQFHDDEEEEDEDQPVVVNAEEAERLRLLAQREKQFYKKGEDGSGWAVADADAAGAAADASLPRRQRHDSPDASPPRRQRHDSPDASPPRRRAGVAAADTSPPRRQRHDSPDLSPPRRRGAAADASPPRRQRHDSPDLSPPRRRAAAADASPPRRQRHDSPDASPPRRQRHDSPDASPPRRRQRHDSPDASPPRRGRQPSPDASPPRRRGGSGDASPPRRQRGAADAAGDASPPRKRRGSDGDEEESTEAKRQKMMSDGTIAGMVSGRELMEEMARKRDRDRKRFEDLGADVTGKGAQTVFRDKEGRAVSKEEYLEQQAAAKKKAQYDSEAQLEWGGGLAQKAEAAARAAAMAAEASKPFARRADDPELDAHHRRRSRWGDPMAGLVKPRDPEAVAPPSNLVDKHAKRLKKGGFIVPQEVPKHSWLRRGVGAPVNRYGIKPGRHWDGVDRGNGFERDMFKRQNELRRQAQEAYMWAQEDM